MPEGKIVWLIRHGTPEGADGRCYGRHDIPLSGVGVEEAGTVARYLATERLTHVYTSPLRRALDTARIIAEPHSLTVEQIDGLAEIHFGDFEGLSYDEIRTQFRETYQLWMERPVEVRFPNGESFHEMRERVLAAMNGV